MSISIDIVIASYRLEERYILPLLQLRRPALSDIRFYLVADNPTISPSPAISQLVDNETIFLQINKTNLGASASRNKGMEAGSGRWVLFLDDDILVPDDLLLVYESAILQNPEEIGFIGPVNFPPPPTFFAKALVASGAMDIFSVAAHEGYHAWGPSANFMVNRQAAGGARFSSLYPKQGGGEDVDFFFQVREQNGRRDFRLLPQAAVTHPWWGNGQRQISRFFRYGTGNAVLPARFPVFRYFDFPNILEIHILSAAVWLCALVTGFISPALPLAFMVASLVFEWLFIWLNNLATKKSGNPLLAWEVFCIHYATYMGYWYANWFKHKKPILLERFNFTGQPRKSFQLNRRKIIKGIFYILALLLFYVWNK